MPCNHTHIHCPECNSFMSLAHRRVEVKPIHPEAFNWVGESYAVCGDAYANSNFGWLWLCDECGYFADNDDLTEQHGVCPAIVEAAARYDCCEAQLSTHVEAALCDEVTP